MNANQAPKISPNRKHPRQASYQIWLPVALAVLIFLALCVLAVNLTVSDQPVGKNWAALSVLWWILPSCLGGLIPLVILGGSVYGVGKAVGGLPGLAAKIQGAVDRVSSAVKNYSNRAASPVIKASKLQAAGKQAWDSTTGKKQP